MRRLFFAVVLLAACSDPGPLRVEGAFARPVPAAGDVGAVYLEVVNPGAAPDRLLSATSALAADVETHETVDEAGVARMVARPEGFVVPARGRVALEPGGRHLMLYDVRRPVSAGDAIPLRLHFEKAGTIEVSAPVRGH